MEKKIKRFFDEKSNNRNIVTESDPILKYEQEMRGKAIVELLNLKKDELILDVGCGNARDLLVFAMKGIKCIGIDYSIGMIKTGKKDINGMRSKNIHLTVGSGTYLPFKNETFDKVSCSEVIEHIPNYEDAIIEINRVLKVGGKLVITTPNWYSLYGVSRKLFEFSRGFVLKKSTHHPYDEWKSQKKVIEILMKYNMEINEKIGICFLPGYLGYKFPRFLKEATVKMTSYGEMKLRKILTGNGYMIGVSAIKKDIHLTHSQLNTVNK